MFALAMTGWIAGGKSLFGRMLAGLGAEVADADETVRALHAPGAAGSQAVARDFGADFLAPDGSTDRARLGALVFADPDARRRLEEVLHPLVRSALLAWKNRPAADPATVRVAQIPLLFESGWFSDWDAAAAVETSDIEVRVERLAGRGLSRDAALARISAQLSPETRLARADFAVRNDGSAEDLRAAARILLDNIRRRMRQTP